MGIGERQKNIAMDNSEEGCSTPLRNTDSETSAHNHEQGCSTPLRNTDSETPAHNHEQGCSIPLTNGDPETSAHNHNQGIWQKLRSTRVPLLYVLIGGGVAIFLIIILGACLFITAPPGKDPARLPISTDQLRMMMEIRKQLCVNTGEKPDECAVCPSGWLRHRENCYYFSSGEEHRTWKESQEVCEEMGAHLLVIEDREQQEFINRSVKQQTDGKFWMGLYRDGDGWRWVDGGHYDISLLQISGRSSGDCVWIGTDSGDNNDRCTSKHSWICQKRSLKI